MRIIPLSQGLIALVSDEDFEYLNQWKWYAAKNKRSGEYYARRMEHKTGKLIGTDIHHSPAFFGS